MKPAVLYVSYDGMTDPLGQAQVLPYLCGLAEDYRIWILSCEKPERFESNRAAIQEICDSAGIVWNPTLYSKRPPVLSTVKDVRRLHREALGLYKEHEFNAVHCRSYIPALVGLRMKQRFRTKFIFDMRGFWPEERIDGNLWRLSNPVHRLVYQFFKKRESQFLQQADAIISLTHAAKDEMLTWDTPVSADRIHVIPCCADFQHFDFRRISKDCTAAVRSKLNIDPATCVVSYLGSIGTWYLLDEMLEFFQRLNKEHPDTLLLFITNDASDVILERANSIGVAEELIRFTSGSRQQVPDLLAVSDVNLFFIKPAYSKMSSSPTKLAEVLGMGIPVICNRGVGDIDSIFTDPTLGYAVDVAERKTWKLPIEKFQLLMESDKRSIRDAGMSQFNLASGVESYREIYQTLIS